VSVAIPAAYATTNARQAQDAGSRASSQLLIGSWHQILIGIFQPEPADQLVTTSYWGLHHTETRLDFFLRSASGHSYYLASDALVNAGKNGQLRARPWLPKAMKSSAIGVVPDPRTRPWTGKATQQMTPQGQVQYTASDGRTRHIVTFDDKSVVWQTRNRTISLRGVIVGPGIDWLLPTRAPDGSTDELYYAAQEYSVTGRYYGRKVSGYLQIENFYGTVGYRKTWWYKNRLGNWVYWANQYSDGSEEYGQFLCGQYGARGAAIANNKGQEVLETGDVSASLGRSGNITYTLGNGERWKYITAGRLPGHGMTRYGAGLVERLGEQRKIVRHNAFSMIAGRVNGRRLC